MSRTRPSPARLVLPRRPTTGPVSPQAERERIRTLLLESRPDLHRRLQVSPSGALLIPLSPGRSIEIGRMRRRGAARWVVAAPAADGAHLHEPPTLAAVVRTVLAALGRAERQDRSAPR